MPSHSDPPDTDPKTANFVPLSLAQPGWSCSGAVEHIWGKNERHLTWKNPSECYGLMPGLPGMRPSLDHGDARLFVSFRARSVMQDHGTSPGTLSVPDGTAPVPRWCPIPTTREVSLRTIVLRCGGRGADLSPSPGRADHRSRQTPGAGRDGLQRPKPSILVQPNPQLSKWPNTIMTSTSSASPSQAHGSGTLSSSIPTFTPFSMD